MIFIDPPEHTRMRKLKSKGFGPAAAEALRPQVEKIADRVLHPLGEVSQADLVKEIACPMPVGVISELGGVPERMHDAFLLWSAAIAEFNGSSNRTVATVRMRRMRCLRLPAYRLFRTDVAERRRNKTVILIDFKEEGKRSRKRSYMRRACCCLSRGMKLRET
jgi:cytochrome P450